MHRACFVWTPTPPLSGLRTNRPGLAPVCRCVLSLAGSGKPASWARFCAPHLPCDRFVLLLCSAPSRLGLPVLRVFFFVWCPSWWGVLCWCLSAAVVVRGVVLAWLGLLSSVLPAGWRPWVLVVVFQPAPCAACFVGSVSSSPPYGRRVRLLVVCGRAAAAVMLLAWPGLVGAARGRPGRGASCLGVGHLGFGRSPTPDGPCLGRAAGARYPLAVCAGNVGEETPHQPHSTRSCELALHAEGRQEGARGRAPVAWVWGVRYSALSHAPPPVLGACGQSLLPTGCGRGDCWRGDPPSIPQRALL